MMKTSVRTAFTVTAAALLLAGCGGSGHTATPESPSAAPSSSYDGSTLAACKEAALVSAGKDSDDNEHAKLARADAELSDLPTLRNVAKKYSDAPAGTPLDEVRALTAAYTIDTWCIQHHVKP